MSVKYKFIAVFQVEYCNFVGGGGFGLISCENSVTIQRCKFNRIWIELKKGGSLIQYNTFDRNPINCQIDVEEDSQSIIQYNEIKNIEGGGIDCENANAIIRYNNFTNISSYAIYAYGAARNTLTVENNYIANCNRINGIDITGAQSNMVIYSNPETSPISNAGSGW